MADEHDPWNNVEDRHPRAQQLMAPELWDCVDEDAPFGSDEGAEAYEEFRRWRGENPDAPLRECLEWIGSEENYPDVFTFDATVIATVLGQLVDEGRIDSDVKPAARRAIQRQMVEAEDERRKFLQLVEAAVDAA